MGVTIEKPRLTWMEPVPVVFAHEIASAKIIGTNVSVIFGMHRIIEREELLVPILELVRPLESCLRMTLRDMLARQIAHEARPVLPLHH